MADGTRPWLDLKDSQGIESHCTRSPRVGLGFRGIAISRSVPAVSGGVCSDSVRPEYACQPLVTPAAVVTVGPRAVAVNLNGV